jgi:ubiquinol-cytochrome c reductase iron-sulfur subunit
MAKSGKDVELSRGSAVQRTGLVENPGFEPEHKRVHDRDPARATKAERGISALFLISGLMSVAAFALNFAFPIVEGDLSTTRLNTLFVGVGNLCRTVEPRRRCRPLGESLDARS